jgi:hypothetical protein
MAIPSLCRSLDGSSCNEEQSVFDAAVKLNLSPPQSFALVCRIQAINDVETFDAHWRSGIFDVCYNKPGNIPPLSSGILQTYGRIYSVVDFPKPVPPAPPGAPNSVTCQPPSDSLASKKG